MPTNRKPWTPAIVARFQAYKTKHFQWGMLYHCLEHRRLNDVTVGFVVQAAQQHGDREAVALARILLKMTQAQREEFYRVANGLA